MRGGHVKDIKQMWLRPRIGETESNHENMELNYSLDSAIKETVANQ